MPAPESRRRVYEVLEVAAQGDRLSRWTDLVLIAVVAANVVAVVLESVEPIYRRFPASFEVFEMVSASIFAVEYLLRVWSAPERNRERPAWRERLRWMSSPLALADLGAILPVLLAPFIGVDLRMLRVLRLVRILKLARYYGSLEVILEVLQTQRRAYGAALFILGLLLLLASSGIYVVEQDAQPDAFGSIPAAMWWALVTLTTVGYGDVTPVTHAGKLFASFVTVIGVGVVALPTGILASGFLDVYQRNRETLREDARRATADGYLSPEETAAYEALAERLGIVPETAARVMRAAHSEAAAMGETPDACPHCGKDIRAG